MTFSAFLSNSFVLGLLEAAPLILATMGFTLIFCLNGFTNIAYAENITLGAYFAVIFNSILGWNFYVSIIPSAILSGLFSALTYLLVFRPAFKRGVGKTEMIILSVGLSFFVRYGTKLVFGNNLFSYDFSSPSYLKLFGIGITNSQLACIGLSLVIALLLYWFMYKTDYGERMRALSDNEELANISGINPTKVSVLIWFIAGAAGGLAGVFYGSFSYVVSSLGWNLILPIIMITIVGRIGSVRGALLASIAVGIITTGITLVSKQIYGQIVILVVFIIILKLRKVRI